MIKKILVFMLSICLIVGTVAIPTRVMALDEDVDMDMGTDELLYKTLTIPELGGKYKTQGRTSIINNLLMVDYSASGIEFSANCEKDVSITFNASSLASGDEGGCYFTVIVDGVKKARDFCHITKTGETTIKLAENLSYGKHTFEIYRQTEIERAIVGIKSVTLFGEVLPAPKYNDLYVEFVGDSISTAYGNLTTNGSGVTSSAPKHQDVTQGYAYLTARALDADWSIVAQQGRGAKYGYTDENLQDIYPKLRYNRDRNTNYDFAREPDYVVIALGTNDILTYASKNLTLDDVKTGFKEMLSLVRQKNPNAKIVWAYNMMTSSANKLITSVIDEAGGELSGYYSVELTNNTGGGNGHPYYTAHTTMAGELSAFIKGIEASLQYGLGDSDEDGSVNLKDLVRLAQYNANWDVALNKVVSDANGDKKIDLSDVNHLAQYLAGWDISLGAPLDYTSGVSGVANKHLSVYSDVSGFKMPYHLYLPKNYNKNKEYPVLLYFHGASAKGNTNKNTAEHLEPFYNKNAKTLSEAIVIAPQCPQNDDELWGKYAGWWRYNTDGKGTLDVAMRLLDDVVLNKYNCDANRLYVMGVSMGGEATWKTLEKYGNKIAAATPICGSRIGNTAFEDATKFKDVPIWMYHGTADTTIPFTDSETRYNNLLAAGAKKVTFTIYEGLNHDIWDDVALDTTMMEWMFEQNLSDR